MVTLKLSRIIQALLVTVKDCQDLENLYNDKTGESFSWDEVREELAKNFPQGLF